MSMTNVRLRINGGGVHHPEYYRVKLTLDGFPYIVIDNDQYMITSDVFPRKVYVGFNNEEAYVELIEGARELKQLLSNPNLTTDKLNLKQRIRAI